MCPKGEIATQESVPVTLGYTFPFHIYIPYQPSMLHIHNGRRGLNYMYKTCLKHAAFLYSGKGKIL